MSHPKVREFAGMCDASASVVIDADHFLVASDEDNFLRVYRHDTLDGPVMAFDWGLALGILPGDAHPEADIEAAARIGDRVFWITSHGANREGKPRPNRRRFFATDIEINNGTITLTPVGTPFRRLIEALDEDPRLAKFKLAEKATHAPESSHGLNIEGIAATPDERLLIAFRNPIPDGQALLVPLKNPKGILTGGKAPKFGDPIQIKLGNRGVRSIDFSEVHDCYFIVAGPIGDEGHSALYQWKGEGANPMLLSRVDFAGLNPEAVLAPEAPDTRLLLLSDDGGLVTDGVACKEAPPNQRKFRSLWIEP